MDKQRSAKHWQHKFARIATLISLAWALFLFGCLGLSYLEPDGVGFLSFRLAGIGGVIIIGAIVLLLHGLLLLAEYQRLSAQGAIIVFLLSPCGMLLLTILTGFSIGMLLLPPTILVILASIASFSAKSSPKA